MRDPARRFHERTGVVGVVGAFDAWYTPRSPLASEDRSFRVGVIGGLVTLFDGARKAIERLRWKHNPSIPVGSVAIAVTVDEVIIAKRSKICVRYPIDGAFGLASYRSVDEPWIEIRGDRFWTVGTDMDTALQLRRKALDAHPPE